MTTIAVFVFFLGACIGHMAILIFSINWWYGQPLPHRLLFVMRTLYGVLILLGWWAFAKAFLLSGFELSAASWATGWKTIATAYAILCAIVGLGYLPLLTIRRRTYRPKALRSNHATTLDFAAQLGYRPEGRGKYRLLTRLPGNEVFKVDFAERTLQLPRLPTALEGLSIVQISDLHFSGSPDLEFYKCLADRCREWDPDLVAVTGDLVDTDLHYRWIVPVLGRLRWRSAALAILGNHDSWHDVAVIRRRLKRLGMHVLGNGWIRLSVRDEQVVFIGNEGPWFRPPPDLSNCPAGGFRICLSHTPDNIGWCRQQGVDLMLSGHNHGGQVRFPLLGSLLVPSRYGRRYDCGTFDEPPTVLHVTRGLAGQHPLRYLCKPEVTRLVLTGRKNTP
ncbi:MAG TPA: metallophosphoesterase [Gemmataceae bacterium]|nr:metallophosphoesterase [Gemmataceae bacterium]